MTIRGVEFDLYTKAQDPVGFKAFGYVSEIEALCVMNDRFVVFTVRRDKRFWSDPRYSITFYLHPITTGRILGRKECDTFDEAVKFGTDLVKTYFPEASVMAEQNEEVT